jgi:inner membrane protein
MLQHTLSWFLFGIIALFLEIFVPRYYLISIGLGALNSGLSTLVVYNPVVQIVVLLVSFVLFRLWFLHIDKKYIQQRGLVAKNRHLIGKIGTITKELGRKKRGFVRINNDEWPAVSSDSDLLPIDKKVKVIRLKGSKLVVQNHNEKKMSNAAK